jgi:hypothetical protein
MLLNPLYKGELIWGKTETYKDHETGIRKRYRRPESEWIRRNESTLVIVDPCEWDRAQTAREMKARSNRRDPAGRIVGNRQGGRKRAKNLLTGWLQCDKTVALPSMLSTAEPGAVDIATTEESRLARTAFESPRESWKIASWADWNASS